LVLNHKGIPIHQGKTPTTVELKAGRGWFLAGDYSVKYSKDGYADKTVPVKQNLNGWYVFGNLLIGGLIGWVIVDPITGAMYTVQDVHGSLDPRSATRPAVAGSPGTTQEPSADSKAKVAEADRKPGSPAGPPTP
jgi:hypothetical protein